MARRIQRSSTGPREGESIRSDVVAEALSRAALLAVARLGLGSSPAIGLSGGVMCSSERFRTIVVDGIIRGELRPRTAVLNSADEALAFVDRAGKLPGLMAEVGGFDLTIA